MLLRLLEEIAKLKADQVRMESDSVGEKAVPAYAYYGVQSLRGAENFPITGRPMIPEMINNLAVLKKACAIANKEAGVFDAKIADAIVAACDDILAGKFHDQFIVDAIQGSAGTSMNMNANEVIANIAIEKLGGRLGDYSIVHPNDHVNNGQSTNDIIPSAGKMTILDLIDDLEPAVEGCIEALSAKAKEFDGIVKMGRTQLQDAVPIRLGQEFNAYATAAKRSLARLKHAKEEMYGLNMGGSAIGTGLNADVTYYKNICPVIAKLTGRPYYQLDDMVDGTMHTDCYAAVSSAMKDMALVFSKIADDFRLMSSGPKTGIGEIHLPDRQNGSSIMPGKINPVIPEVVNQCAFKVIGNDVTISEAVKAGQFELNAFEPIIFYSLFESISIMTQALTTFRVNCIDGVTANADRCLDLLNRSAGISTALCPHIGYKKAAAIAKECNKTDVPVRKLVLDQGLMTEEQLDKVLDPYKMTTPGILG